MRYHPSITPISDAARFFSKHEDRKKRAKPVKSKAGEFHYPSFDHQEYNSDSGYRKR